MRGRRVSAGVACQENQANDTNIPKPESLEETCNHWSIRAISILLLFHRPRPRHNPVGRRDHANWMVYRIWIREIIEEMGKRRVQRPSTPYLGIRISRVLHRSRAYPRVQRSDWDDWCRHRIFPYPFQAENESSSESFRARDARKPTIMPSETPFSMGFRQRNRTLYTQPFQRRQPWQNTAEEPKSEQWQG